MEVNAEGTTFPIIYSDETNVPAVEKVFGVSHEEAEQYVPFGCGRIRHSRLQRRHTEQRHQRAESAGIALHNGLDFYQNVSCGEKRPATGAV